MRDEALQVWLEPRAQRAINRVWVNRVCGLLHRKWGWVGLTEKLSKAERGGLSMPGTKGLFGINILE